MDYPLAIRGFVDTIGQKESLDSKPGCLSVVEAHCSPVKHCQCFTKVIVKGVGEVELIFSYCNYIIHPEYDKRVMFSSMLLCMQYLQTSVYVCCVIVMCMLILTDVYHIFWFASRLVFFTTFCFSATMFYKV